MGGGVVLGIAGEWATDYREPSDIYTSKIGGLPDWPFPYENLAPDLLNCIACGSKFCLVAQVHAPISSGNLKIEDRAVLVFGCTRPDCRNTQLGWRAFRIQKSGSERESSMSAEEVVPSTPPVSASKANWLDDESDEDMDLETLSKALSEAGTLASQSKKPHGNGHSETLLKISPSVPRTSPVDMETPVVPCFYIIKEEPPSKDLTSICSNYSSLSIMEKQNENDSDHEMEEAWGKEEYEYDKALTADRTYLKFKKHMDANVDQCFRYWYGGRPLLATAELGDPGKCKFCGSLRHYEMQLTPQLIYFLKEEADSCQIEFLENWEWLTLIVYTCSKSCSNSFDQEKSTTCGWIVAEEAVLVQFEEPLPESASLAYFS